MTIQRWRSFSLLFSVLFTAAVVNAFFVPHSPVNVKRGKSTTTQPATIASLTRQNFSLAASSKEDSQESSSKKLPMLLDPGTKGGALFLSLVLFVVPILGYVLVTSVFGFDELEAGKWIGVGFTFITTVLWVGSYVFRVATKDMTYAKQLKDYENAVIAKRLEELDEDEVQALVEDIERDEF